MGVLVRCVDRMDEFLRRDGAVLMTTPPTDEQLARWEQDAQLPSAMTVRAPVHVLIQEVRRLREERNDALAVEKAAMEIADTHLERAEKAEAEVEKLRKVVQGHLNLRRTLSRTRADLRAIEAERDRYKGALEEIASYGPELDNTPPTPPQVALAALSQPVREEGEKE